MDRFQFFLCAHCGNASTKAKDGQCGACSSRKIETRYLEHGPYSRQEFAEFLSRRTIALKRGDLSEVIDRLIATVSGGFAR